MIKARKIFAHVELPDETIASRVIRAAIQRRMRAFAFLVRVAVANEFSLEQRTNNVDQRVMHDAVAIIRRADQPRLGLHDLDGAKIPERVFPGAQQLLDFNEILLAPRVELGHLVAKALAFLGFF